MKEHELTITTTLCFLQGCLVHFAHVSRRFRQGLYCLVNFFNISDVFEIPSFFLVLQLTKHIMIHAILYVIDFAIAEINITIIGTSCTKQIVNIQDLLDEQNIITRIFMKKCD